MNENDSLKTIEPVLPVPVGYVSVQTVLEALYSAILRRDITEQELEERLANISSFDRNQLTHLIRSFVLSPEFATKLDTFIAEQPLLRRDSIHRISSKFRAVAVVAVADEVWLPFCLAIADYLAEEYSLQTLLVTYSLFDRANDARQLSKAVVGCVHIQDLSNLADSFEPDLMVVHSFGWQDSTQTLLDTYPHAPLIVYGDSYKNSVSDVFDKARPISKVIMFGFDDRSYPSVCRAIITSDAINFYRKCISKFYQLSELFVANEPLKYSVFYMRYWGVSVYSSLSADKIVGVWKTTVLPNLSSDEVLIIKNDPRVDLLLYNRAIDEFRAAGVNVLPFEEYVSLLGCDVKSFGLLPVEFFFLNGLLCRARSHFVLDSGLAYSLVVQELFNRPFNVFVGADDLLLDKDSDSVAIENIKYGVDLYSYGLLNSPEISSIDKYSELGPMLRCFEIK